MSDVLAEETGIMDGVSQPPPNVGVRLSEEEKRLWQAAAKADGIDALGTWIKQVCRKRAAEVLPAPPDPTHKTKERGT